jgi:PAS domain S-box-containing protein
MPTPHEQHEGASGARSMREKIVGVIAEAPLAIALLEGPGHRFIFANARFRSLFGGGDPTGRPALEALPELHTRPLAQILDGVYEHGGPYVAHETPLELPDDAHHDGWEEHLYTFSYQACRDATGAVTGVCILAFEVTDEVLVKASLEARAAELAAIVESIPDPVFVGNAEGVHYCNRAALRNLGVNSALELDRPLGELIAMLDARALATGAPIAPDDHGYTKALAGTASTVELEVRNVRTGEPRIVRASYAPVRQGERVLSAISIHTDITERVQLARALAASEALKQRVIESSADSITLLDERGRVVWMNERGQRLMGAPEPPTGSASDDALRGFDWLDWWKGDQRAASHGAFRLALTGDVADFVGAARSFDGKTRWWEVTLSPLHDPTGGEARVLAISRDVTTRKELEDRRDRLLVLEQRARKDAELANRVKDDFIATVSHELRTPLSAILGWARLLGAGNLSSEKQAQAVQVIERNAKAQAQLVEDLLDVSRILSGKLRLEVVPTELIEVVQAAVDVVRTAADAKGVRMETILEPHAGPLMGDPDRLQQVVWNLLSNAVKFTPKGGRVQVRLLRRESNIELVVEDTGLGIEPEFLPFIFEKFRQADGGASKAHRGLGLGLSIVKYLVEAHGGTIGASSEGVGQGSRFVVRLPVSPLLALDNQAEGAKHPSRSGVSPVLEFPAELSALRVLIVDDEQDARSLLTTVLEQCRSVVIAAANVDEAYDSFVRERPAVVVSDIGMPGATGYELIRKIRALSPEQGGTTPAVALTAYARSEDRMKALAAGFNMHLPKPIEPAELLVVIASLIARTRH